MFQWSNPKGVNLDSPYLYYIRIRSDNLEYRYVGKASNKSRLDEYPRNVEKILKGMPRRPETKRDGKPQSKGNLRYRYVHLVLSAAVQNNWLVEHYPLENVAKDDLNTREIEVIVSLKCNMNEKGTWAIAEHEKLLSDLVNSG